MTDLKTLIDELDAPDDWDSIVRRSPSRTFPDVVRPRIVRDDRIRRAMIAVLSMGVAAFAIFFLIRAFETSPPPRPPLVQPVVRTFELAPGVGHMEFAFGSLWVVGNDGVIRVDPTSGEVVAEIPVPGITMRNQRGAPDWSWVASGADRVWVTAEPDIVGIDPRTNEIAQSFTDQTGVSSITFADGLIVVGGSAEGNGDIRLMDPQTETFADGGGLAGSLAGFPSVLGTRDWYWAGGRTHEGGAALARISKDGTAHEVIEGIASFDSFAAAGGFVWVTGGDHLYRVDDTYEGPAPSPQSVFPAEADAVTAEIRVDGPAQVASDGTTLWLLERTEDGSPRVTEIDPVSGEDRTAPVTLAGDGPFEMTVADGDAWVSFRKSGLLIEVSIIGELPSPSIEAAEPFVPPTHLEGDLVVMAVTFPDGRTAEIVYPQRLELASLAVRAVSFAEPTQAPECAAILYAHHGTERFFHDEGTPEATYPSTTGKSVALWEPPANATYPQAWLVFSFGSWRVGAPVQGSCGHEDVLATWARSVTGRETPDGFLVLETKPPVRAYEPGDPDAPGLIFEDGRFQVMVFSGACTPFDDATTQRIGGKDVQRTEGLAQWCESEDSILVRIEGDDALIDPLTRDIGIRNGSDPFARYFFSASEIVGVLEVSQSPPSICYSTQSSPARPISIILSRPVSGPPPGAPAGVSYAPSGNDFCDRTVDPALAEALIVDPSAYLISWRPEDGHPAVSSSLDLSA